MEEYTRKQNALAAIEDLTLLDCLNHFDQSEDQRAQDIRELCYHNADWVDMETYHICETEDNGAYILNWRWVSFAGSKLSKVCSHCDSKGGEIKCVEMSDGFTGTLCKTCLEMICPGYEAAPERPKRANLKRLATPRTRAPAWVLEQSFQWWDEDGQLRDIFPMDIEQENQLRLQAGLPLLDDVAVAARLSAAREEEEFIKYFRLRRFEFEHLWSDRSQDIFDSIRIYNVVRNALREEMRREHSSRSETQTEQ